MEQTRVVYDERIEKVVDAVLDEIVGALEDGGRIELRGRAEIPAPARPSSLRKMGAVLQNRARPPKAAEPGRGGDPEGTGQEESQP